MFFLRYLLIYLSVIFALGDCSETPHLKCFKQSPCLVSNYELQDLGEIDLDAGFLTRQKEGFSSAPQINDLGEIIGNNSSGGFIYNAGFKKYHPAIKGVSIKFHAINNYGDILISLHRSPEDVSWLIWPTRYGLNKQRTPIDTVELEGNKIGLYGINDQQMIAGEVLVKEIPMPLTWIPGQGLYRIGYEEGLDLQGFAKGINNTGTLFGKSSDYLERFPFTWNGRYQRTLFPHRKEFQPPSGSKIMFEDLVITDDNTLYGTFWFNSSFLPESKPKAVEDKEHRAFSWHHPSDSLKFIDLRGMRISAVNNHHRIVGSINGRACYADKTFAPVEISEMVDSQEIEDWELLEATDINTVGQIVGYGKKEGKIHLFLANPL